MPFEDIYLFYETLLQIDKLFNMLLLIGIVSYIILIAHQFIHFSRGANIGKKDNLE